MAVCVAMLALVGCGGGGGGGGDGVDVDPPPPAGCTGVSTSNTTIKSFEVTVPSSSEKPTPVSPYQDNGLFKVEWSVCAASDPFHVDLYLSSNETLEQSTDREFFEQNCGSASVFDCRTGPATLTCHFDTENKISCAMTSAATPRTTDMTSLLSQLPQQWYLILHACDANLNGTCDDRAVKVEFQ